MTSQSFSFSDALKFGWQSMQSHFGFFFIILLTSGSLCLITHFIFAKAVDTTDSILIFMFSVISSLLPLVLELGRINIALKLHDNDQSSFADLFACYPLILKYFCATILYTIIITAGLILLIVPGIVWSLKFAFFPYVLVDKKCGVLESFKLSEKITAGFKFELFIYYVVLALINFIGALCLGIGLFVTLPVTYMALAFIYRKRLAKFEQQPQANI